MNDLTSTHRRSRLYVLVGVPGSGKTTYARRHLGHAVRLSLDDLRVMMSGVTYDRRYEPMVSEAMRVMLETSLVHANNWHCDLVLDATNVSRYWRRRAIDSARRHDVEPHCVFFDVSLEVARERNAQRNAIVPDDVLLRFYRQLEPPSVDEGFVELAVVGDHV